MKELIRVPRAGPALSLQGEMRTGLAKFGIPCGGCMDPISAKKARQLAKRLPSETVLEIGYGACTLIILETMWIAHTGGLHCAQIPSGRAQSIKAGTKLEFLPGTGMWSYLAIDGEFAVEKEWQSVSKRFDGMSDFSLTGQVNQNMEQHLGGRFFQEPEPLAASEDPVCTIYQGPHFAHFSKEAIARLATERWIISHISNRSGYRLDGPKIHCNHEINSTPTLLGSLQIPPSGQPIVTLNDGPTSGGYPVIAVIDPEKIHHLTQRRPGQEIHFNWHDSTFA